MGRTKRIYNLILRTWPLFKVGLWLGKQPGIDHVLKPVFSTKIHQVTMIPVNEAIAQGKQTVLPYSLLQQLVEQASARFIMEECVCRRHEGCQKYSAELGCMFLGEGASHIHPSLGHTCSKEEADEHLQRGMEAGLYPLIAHTIIDSLALGIQYKRMLTVCFCCECCCLVHRGLRSGPTSLLDVVQRLPGLKLSVGEGCMGCADCIDRCPVHAISLNHRSVEIGEDCKGCGICVHACPQGAITMEMEGDEEILSGFFRRVNSYADILPSKPDKKSIPRP